ncbi:unnamed protein product [Moneuplotes crassus]|uniref:Uncharacterized protein n=1 Tax=Euplotes crassus TaxID=5936 RepID=A0AAD1YA99_EUPCR|nr:unnamed protein product [Moneuplotes crassus]
MATRNHKKRIINAKDLVKSLNMVHLKETKSPDLRFQDLKHDFLRSKNQKNSTEDSLAKSSFVTLSTFENVGNPLSKTYIKEKEKSHQKEESKFIMKKKKAISMLKKKHTNSILKVYCRGKRRPTIKDYKPPKGKPSELDKAKLLDKRRTMMDKEHCCSLVDPVLSSNSIQELSLVPEDLGSSLRVNKNSTLLLYSSGLSTPQNIRSKKFINSKMSASNFCRYQSLSRNKSGSKVCNTKLAQKPLFMSKKSRNNLTLDGMNLTSINSSQIPQSNSMVIKMISKNNKMKGFHSKFRSETLKRKRGITGPDSSASHELRNNEKSVDKRTTATKERSIVNVVKDNIEKSLKDKINALDKDLKKKQIEFTIRKQHYNENLTQMSQKSNQDKLRLHIYEMLRNPRYEFDLEQVQSLKAKHTVLKEGFHKCLTLIRDDNLQCLMKIMKTNYDGQIEDIISNAERNLRTIQSVQDKFDSPVNNILDQMNALELKLVTEQKKSLLEVEEHRQQVEQLTKELKDLKNNSGADQEDLNRKDKRLLKEMRVINRENLQMKEVIQEFKDEVDYCKQRENKLMYFLYIMKEKGLPVGEIFEQEIKEIPTKRFSKYFDDESPENCIKERPRKYISLSERVLPGNRDPAISDTTSIMNITEGQPKKQRKPSLVPKLNLEQLPPRKIHYFSEDSERSGYDLSVERKKFNENATVSQKYDLASFGKRMKLRQLKRHSINESFQKSKIMQLGSKLFPSESL